MRGETRAPPLLGAACGFQSTPLMRGETPISLPSISAFGFQSTPLMRGETNGESHLLDKLDISIHSPHARGDPKQSYILPTDRISIHSPHARGDEVGPDAVGGDFLFQSTPLMRGETRPPSRRPQSHSYFNPLPSCEGRQHKPPKILLDSRQFI